MTDIVIAAKYNGYVVKWNDNVKSFSLYEDSNKNELVKDGFLTLEEAQRWIDKKVRAKYRRVPVFVSFGWRSEELEEAEATSTVNEHEVWVVTTKDKTRRKVNTDAVWLDTPENRSLIKTFRANSAEIHRLEKENHTIANRAARLKASMIEEKD